MHTSTLSRYRTSIHHPNISAWSGAVQHQTSNIVRTPKSVYSVPAAVRVHRAEFPLALTDVFQHMRVVLHQL